MESGKDAPDQEQLDELGEKIAKARRDAEEVSADPMGPDGLFTDAEPAFYESGDHPEDDDQTIAP